jgi:tRNA(His) guanylyltransferase
VNGSTTLGKRMKSYETLTRLQLPRRTYSIIRLDGRSFHTYTRGCGRPFDYDLIADMNAVAEALCREVTGTVFAFTQSDEVSLLVCDFASPDTQPWFDGVVQKTVSVSAALAASVFNTRRYSRVGRLATFDARVFTIADPVEVANYFLWRQRDCVRNSIAMAAQAQFSHRELHGVSTTQAKEKLRTERGINWDDYPTEVRQGRVCTRVTVPEPVSFRDGRTGTTTVTVAERTRWVSQPAPLFTTEPGAFLAKTVPALPNA